MSTETTLPKTSDELRHKILEQFEQFKPHLKSYHDYAERIAALSLEYHTARIGETLPVPIEEGTLICSLDARETPKSLDVKLEQLASVTVRRIIFDPTKATYHIYV